MTDRSDRIALADGTTVPTKAILALDILEQHVQQIVAAVLEAIGMSDD